MALCLITTLICNVGCKPPGGKPGEGKGKGSLEDSKKKPSLVSVDVSALKNGPMERVVKAATDLIAEESVSVYSRTANFVAELVVEEGDIVEKGQVLARLENDIQTTRHEKALVSEERARLEYERLKSLSLSNIISDQEFKNAELELRQQKLQLEEARRELDYTEVKAPISGTITDRLINLGDIINNNHHMFDMVNFESIKAPVYLPEAELPRLKAGLLARVKSPSIGNRIFEGKVERISPLVDARSGTVEVIVGFNDIGQLRPGMYVNVEIVTDTLTDVLLVPREALIYDADQVFAYRLVKGKDYPNRSIERVLIQPAMEDRFNVTVNEGLSEGDKLIVIGKAGLRVDSLIRLPGDPEKLPEDEPDNDDDGNDKDDSQSKDNKGKSTKDKKSGE